MSRVSVVSAGQFGRFSAAALTNPTTPQNSSQPHLGQLAIPQHTDQCTMAHVTASPPIQLCLFCSKPFTAGRC